MRAKTEADGGGRQDRRKVRPLLFAVLGTGLALGAALAHLLLAAPAGSGTKGAEVRILPGSDLRQIANALERAEVIASPPAFLLAARISGLERRLRPGDYRFASGLTLPELLQALLEGRGRSVGVTIPEGWRLEQIADRLAAAGLCGRAAFLAAARDPALLQALLEGRGRSVGVTIPEGWRLEQIADRLAAAGLCGREAFLAAARDPVLLREAGIAAPSAEGFLFPETYSFPQPAEPADIVRAMHRQFAKVWAELTAGAPPANLTPLQAVTLASIVERETAAPAERPLVAAVFLNRLRIGMPLQADPTVIYGISGFDGNLRRRDLARPNPYNTYVIRGLPPGPIAGPGRTSLAAVLRPAPVDYLYFVARADGTHQFSRTLREHNQAVQRFQAAGGKHRG
jgi:UPF0755 protein